MKPFDLETNFRFYFRYSASKLGSMKGPFGFFDRYVDPKPDFQGNIISIGVKQS